MTFKTAGWFPFRSPDRCLGRAGCVGAGLAGLVAIIAVGCSSSAGSGGPATDAGGDAADGSQKLDASLDGSGHDAMLNCGPADVSTFQPPPYVSATGAYQGLCTPQQIPLFFADCLATTATQATCAPFAPMTGTPENKACASCIVTLDNAMKFGAIIEHKGVVNINLAGCMELVDGAKGLMCAKAYQAADACDRAACAANCPVTDDASFALYQACTQQAAMNGCLAYSQGAACQNDEAAADGGAQVCFMGQTFQELYNSVVPIFCGTAPAVDGGSSDAGADG